MKIEQNVADTYEWVKVTEIKTKNSPSTELLSGKNIKLDSITFLNFFFSN